MKYFNSEKIKKYKWALKVISFFLNLFQKNSQSKVKRIDRILIIDFHLIGDVVMLTPFILGLRKKYPKAEICLLAGQWAPIVLKGFDSEIDKIYEVNVPWVKKKSYSQIFFLLKIIVKLKKKNFDLGFDMRGDFRNSLILKILGIKKRVGYDLMLNGDFLTDVVPLKDNLVHLTDYHFNMGKFCGIFLEEDTYKPTLKNAWLEKVNDLVGVHLGASLPLKQFPVNYLGNLLTDLNNENSSNTNFRIFEIPEIPNLAKQILELCHLKGMNAHIFSGNLKEFFNGLSQCEKLYCLDSGPGHIAAAMGLEVKSYFGPTDPKFCAPIGNVNIMQKLDKPLCWPCEALTCNNLIFKECFNLYE